MNSTHLIGRHEAGYSTLMRGKHGMCVSQVLTLKAKGMSKKDEDTASNEFIKIFLLELSQCEELPAEKALLCFISLIHEIQANKRFAVVQHILSFQ